MCGLCGTLGQVDWTDRSASPEAFPGELPRLQAERQQMAALVSRVLAVEGLRLSVWQGSGYVLRSATGKQTVLASLTQVWSEAERMLGRPVDPLSPRVAAAMVGG
jgi:hypothetical protein